ncbi:amidohydrolase [Cellulomonas fimi]|uniref:Amidohydrolase n=1 Tax=Cellulomonas fimi TaxID=1708 RepID=A0A7Y0LWM6_CELFI|nr:amidohydrolase [Cellulomonas fimi]NMR19251.1 amidohydrolase [Cellulomonas fimi]
MSSETRIVGGTVVTMDKIGTVHTAGEVAYGTSGTLTYVGPSRGPARPGDLDVSGDIVMPGLVNAHAHSAMTPLRGFSDDQDLEQWLRDMRRFEVKLTAEDIAWGLRLAMVEMLRSGTTTFADMFRWDAALLGDVVGAGMRVLAAPAIFTEDSVGFPTASPQDGRATMDLTEQLAQEFAGDRHVRITFGPHAPYTCSPELLREVARRAAAAQVGVQIHLSEGATEVRQNIARYARTPIAHVASLGLLEVPTLVAHAVAATDEDIEILAAAGAAVSHNPVSNLKLGSGVAPVPAMLAAGLTLGLGTDGVASNNTLDMFEEIKVGTILQRGHHQQAGAVGSATFLRMATSEGARAVGFPETGSLEAGRWADLVVVRTDSPRATPLHSLGTFLGFAAQGQDVRHVVVDGRHVVREGVVTTLDEQQIKARVAATATRIVRELKGEDA